MGKPYQRASDGLWAQQIELPRRGDGVRRRKYLYARTKAELSAKVRSAQREVALIGDMATSSPRLDRWLERWLDEIVRPSLKPKTIASYEYQVDLITASIGAVKLSALKPSHVREMLTWVQDERGLSVATAATSLRVLRKALNDARTEGLLSNNVAQLVKAPPKSKSEIAYLDADQARAFLMSVAHDPRAAIRWSLALMMGMRQGECLGLRVDHVDLDEGWIDVQWQLQRPATPPRPHLRQVDVGAGYFLLEVKTATSDRRLPMPPQLLEMMRRYVPTLDGPDSFVCWHGPRDLRADEREWKRRLAAADLLTVKLHSARHSTLTLLAQLGVPDHVRRRIAGHASEEVTKRVYTHAQLTELRDAFTLAEGAIERASGAGPVAGADG